MPTSALPVLYSCYNCPYAMRARLALAYCGLRCELREVLLSDKPAALRALSDKATTPVLQLADGGVIDDSLAVMQWARRQHSPAGFWPDSEAEHQALQALIEHNDHHFAGLAYRYIYPERFPDLSRAQLRSDAADWLATLEQRLQQQCYLFGERLGFADLALFPFVYLFAEADRPAFDELAYPGLRRWLAALGQLPWLAAQLSALPPWSPGDRRRYLDGVTV